MVIFLGDGLMVYGLSHPMYPSTAAAEWRPNWQIRRRSSRSKRSICSRCLRWRISLGVAQNCRRWWIYRSIPLCVDVKVKTIWLFHWLVITQYIYQLFLGLSHWVDKKIWIESPVSKKNTPAAAQGVTLAPFFLTFFADCFSVFVRWRSKEIKCDLKWLLGCQKCSKSPRAFCGDHRSKCSDWQHP